MQYNCYNQPLLTITLMKKLFGLLMGLVASFVLMIPVASAQSWGWVTSPQPVYYTQYSPYGYSNPYYTAPVNYYYKQVTKLTPTAKAFYYLSTLPNSYYYPSYNGYYYNTNTYNAYNTGIAYTYTTNPQKYYKYGYKYAYGDTGGNVDNTWYSAYYTTNPQYTFATKYSLPLNNYLSYWY